MFESDGVHDWSSDDGIRDDTIRDLSMAECVTIWFVDISGDIVEYLKVRFVTGGM